MEISLNRNNGGLEVSKFGGLELDQASKHPNIQTSKPLTITHGAATPEEIAAAEIPDSALTRDDSLGKLVGQAFNLPPPPMPAFQDLG